MIYRASVALAALAFVASCGKSAKEQPTTEPRPADSSPGAPPGNKTAAADAKSVKPPAKAPPRGAERTVYSLVDNRLSAHLTRGGGLVVPAGSAGFAKYIRFANVMKGGKKPWELRQTEGSGQTAEPLGSMTRGGTLGGQGDAAFTLRAYVDDDEVTAGKAKLRLIHASPGTPAVDVGTGGGALFAPVFTNIAFGSASTVETAPLAGVELSARAHGAAGDALSIEGAALPAGAIATAFAIGQLTSSDAPLRVLLCLDNAEPDGVHSQCSIVGAAPRRAHVRIAHLSPDAPAVDVCLAPAGSPFRDKPLVRSLGATGLSYAQVTAYVDLPVATYSVRIVHAIAPSCATPAIADPPNLTVTPDLTATVAAIGDLEPLGHAVNDPPLRLAVFADDTAVTAGMVKLRFIHASPGTPAVDVGLGTGAAFQRVFANVAFGKVASHPPLSNGYVQTAPFIQAVTARLAGSASDALTVPQVTVEPATISTAFAIGGKTGDPHNPLRVLLCSDNRPADGLLTSCTIAP